MNPPQIPTLPKPTPPPLPEARMELPWWGFLIWVIFGLVLAGLDFRQAGSFSTRECEQEIAAVMVNLLLPLLFAWIAWRIGGRSRMACRVTFGVTLALLLFIHVGQLGRDSLAITEAGAKSKEEMEAAVAKFQKAAAAAKFATLLDVAQYTDQATIAAKRALVQKARAANAELRKFMVGREAAFQSELEQAGVSRLTVEKAMEGFRRGQGDRLELVLKIRDEEDQMEAAADDLLALLDRQWGRWRVAADKNVQFEDTATVTKYNELLTAIRTLGAEQAAIQKRVEAEASR